MKLGARWGASAGKGRPCRDGSVTLLETGCSLLPASLLPKIHRPEDVRGPGVGRGASAWCPGGSPPLQCFVHEKEGAKFVYLHRDGVLVVSWNGGCFGPGVRGSVW